MDQGKKTTTKNLSYVSRNSICTSPAPPLGWGGEEYRPVLSWENLIENGIEKKGKMKVKMRKIKGKCEV
jgi:hypothetical protein